MSEKYSLRKVEKCFRLPLSERFTRIGSPNAISSKLMEVDGIGLVVYYTDEDQVTPENIRRHLIGAQSTHTIIEAETKEEAIKKFHEDWDGAKCGTKAKAIWIEDEDCIVEYALCDQLNMLVEGDIERYICGSELDYDPEEDRVMGYCGCIIEGFDPPEDCPNEGE